MTEATRTPGGSTVGAVVVAFRSAETIVECVESCLVDPRVAHVVVVDNSSDEHTKSLLDPIRQHDGRLTYRATDNIGFGPGCNLGATLLGDVDAVAMVNPDVVLTRGLGELVDRLDESTAAFISGRLILPRDETNINARPLVTIRRELLSALVGSSRVYRETSVSAVPTPGQSALVGQVAGALAVCRTETWAAMGGFDERFELYYEDVDLGRRSIPLGGTMLLNEVWGVHHGGTSASAVSGVAFAVGGVSRIRYLRKYNSPRWWVDLNLVLIGALEFVARTAARRTEGGRGRLRGLACQIAELRAPGSVRVLGATDSSGGRGAAS